MDRTVTDLGYRAHISFLVNAATKLGLAQEQGRPIDYLISDIKT